MNRSSDKKSSATTGQRRSHHPTSDKRQKAKQDRYFVMRTYSPVPQKRKKKKREEKKESGQMQQKALGGVLQSELAVGRPAKREARNKTGNEKKEWPGWTWKEADLCRDRRREVREGVCVL